MLGFLSVVLTYVSGVRAELINFEVNDGRPLLCPQYEPMARRFRSGLEREMPSLETTNSVSRSQMYYIPVSHIGLEQQISARAGNVSHCVEKRSWTRRGSSVFVDDLLRTSA